MDVTSIQRQVANLQKQLKTMADQAKNEDDPKKKAELQKKMVDLNLKRKELDDELESAVSNMHAGMELSFEQVRPRPKWLTTEQRRKVKSFIKRLIKSN